MGMLEILAAGKGDEKVELGEDGVANKAKFDDLFKKRYLVTVTSEGQSKKVTGFDAEKNELIVEESKELRIPATSAVVTAIAPIAGG
jgi:hypothetical protein